MLHKQYHQGQAPEQTVAGFVDCTKHPENCKRQHRYERQGSKPVLQERSCDWKGSGVPFINLEIAHVFGKTLFHLSLACDANHQNRLSELSSLLIDVVQTAFVCGKCSLDLW